MTRERGGPEMMLRLAVEEAMQSHLNPSYIKRELVSDARTVH